MYIEDRLFSESTEEVLFSVLMDEDEYTLYSEFQKEFAQANKVLKTAMKNGNYLSRSVVKEAEKETGRQLGNITKNGWSSLSPARQKMVSNGLSQRGANVKSAMSKNPGNFYPAEIERGATIW